MGGGEEGKLLPSFGLAISPTHRVTPSPPPLPISVPIYYSNSDDGDILCLPPTWRRVTPPKKKKRTNGV